MQYARIVEASEASIVLLPSTSPKDFVSVGVVTGFVVSVAIICQAKISHKFMAQHSR